MVILWHTSTAAWLVSTTHTFTSTVPTATRTSSSALRRLPFPSCLSLGCFAASSGVMEYLSISCLWLGQVDVRGHHPAKDVCWTCHLSRSLKTRPCQPLRPPPGGGTKGLAGARLETPGEVACPTHIFGGVVAPHIHLAKPETTN